VVGYLLLPLLVAYGLYRLGTYAVVAGGGDVPWLPALSRELPLVRELLLDIGVFGILVLAIFAVFFLVMRRAIRRTLATVSPGGRPHYSPAEASQEKVREILRGEARPPMDPDLDPSTIDVFVSGHTHSPSLTEVNRDDGSHAVMVNSGCFLRQLQPVSPRLKGPPVFVSRFVLTHVRVFARGSELRVELREQPKPATQHLTRMERLLSWNCQPPQPPANSEPVVRAVSTV
jgi:hypothetical protein